MTDTLPDIKRAHDEDDIALQGPRELIVDLRQCHAHRATLIQAVQERDALLERCVPYIKGLKDGIPAMVSALGGAEYSGPLTMASTELNELLKQIEELETTCEHDKGLADYCAPCGRIHNDP